MKPRATLASFSPDPRLTAHLGLGWRQVQRIDGRRTLTRYGWMVGGVVAAVLVLCLSGCGSGASQDIAKGLLLRDLWRGLIGIGLIVAFLLVGIVYFVIEDAVQVRRRRRK